MANRNTTPETRSSQEKSLIVLSCPIRQKDGLFSLDDLHIASGGDTAHLHEVFLDTPLAQAWVHDIEERQGESFIAISPLKAGADSPQPVFVCRELAQAYALWVSSEFAAAVLEAFGLTAPQPQIVPVTEPRDRYDLGYVRDLRWDENRPDDAGWWEFDRQNRMTVEEAVSQGRLFFEQTRQLARLNPEEAQTALLHSLFKLVDRNRQSAVIPYCELVFCEWLSRAAVVWMMSSGGDVLPVVSNGGEG